MRKKKSEKPVHTMNDEELASKVFHPKVLAHAKKLLQEQKTKSKSTRA